MSVDNRSPGDPQSVPEPAGELTFNTSVRLLRRAQEGDDQALDQLLQLYLPTLRRWATGRLPRWARERFETADLVQEMLLAVLPHVDDFQPRGHGALRAYMRQTLLNLIRREIRRANRRPRRADVDELEGIQGADPAASPLERTIGKELVARYEAALARMSAREREAIIARLEMGCSFEQIARILGKPTANAARMAVSRAVERLAQEMGNDPI